MDEDSGDSDEYGHGSETERQRIRRSRKLMDFLGFYCHVKDKRTWEPLISAVELYEILMDEEECKNFINNVRKFKMKAFL